MKIAFLTSVWPVFGGGETVTVTLANEFHKRGYKVIVLYFKSSEKIDPYLNTDIKSIEISGISNESIWNLNGEDAYSANKQLKKIIEEEQIDVVINQTWSKEALKGIKKQAALIHCLHMCLFYPAIYENFHYRGKELIKILLGRKLYYIIHKYIACRSVCSYFPFVDKFVFLSKHFCDDFRSVMGNKFNEKIDYCSNPLRFDKDIIQADLSKKENIVLYLGRMFEYQKKVSKLLKYWSEIEGSESFSNWKLVLVGDGPDKQMLEKYAKSLGLRNYEFVGYADPIEYYKKAKIFTMTSTFEGFGMTLIEAQNNGVVPIARDTFSSLHDIITNDENGKIIPMQNDKLYVLELMELMSNGEKLIKLRNNGLVSCKRFSVEKIVDRWEKLISEIQQNRIKD